MPRVLHEKDPNQEYQFPLKHVPGRLLNSLREIAADEKKNINDMILVILERSARRRSSRVAGNSLLSGKDSRKTPLQS